MLFALLSPAKKLDFGPAPAFAQTTTPALLNDAALMAARAKKLTRPQLRRIMDLSPALADLTFERFQNFVPANTGGTKPALYAFNGDVYQGFEARTLEADEIAFAQEHIAIISGLYGLLRPLDAIQPYRLEMGSRVATARGKDLYAFWRAGLTAHVNAVTAKLQHPTIVNLASQEYWAALDQRALTAPVVHAAFKEIRGGKASVVSLLAKKARGLMARYIVQHRLTKPDELKAFDSAGYRFDPEVSGERHLVFSRKIEL